MTFSRDDPGAMSCPSAPPEAGSVLLGIVAAPGQIAYLTPHVPVTPALLAELEQKGLEIENRLRFAGPCMGGNCAQWRGGAGGHCGLIERTVEALGITEGADELPRCGLRQSCRWFRQQGRAACAACPEVIRHPAAPA